MAIDPHERERREGGRKRGRRRLDTRPLQLKIRITARRGLIRSREDLIDLIDHVRETHDVPKGVTIHWIDWRKGTGGQADGGRITNEIAEALEKFWLAIAHEDTKILAARLASKGREGKARWARLG